MTREEAIMELNRFSGTTQLKLSANFWTALDMAIKALERESKPYEKFENVKDHIYKLAGDYKCWDNRLTDDEAVELCRILEQEPCEDAISRQAVLDTLDKMDSVLDEDRTVETYKELLTACYKDLPSVTPAHKTGKWIYSGSYDEVGMLLCSNCKHDIDVSEGYFKFCPNCGSFMMKED